MSNTNEKAIHLEKEVSKMDSTSGRALSHGLESVIFQSLSSKNVSTTVLLWAHGIRPQGATI